MDAADKSKLISSCLAARHIGTQAGTNMMPRDRDRGLVFPSSLHYLHSIQGRVDIQPKYINILLTSGSTKDLQTQ